MSKSCWFLNHSGFRGISIAVTALLAWPALTVAQTLGVMGDIDTEDRRPLTELEVPSTAGPHQSHPDHLHHVRFPDAIDHADLIFDGVLVDVNVRQQDGARVLVTDYTFEVAEWLDGRSGEDRITLTSMGGHLPEGGGMTVCGAIKLTANRRYLIVTRRSFHLKSLPVVRAIQITADGSSTIDEAGRVITGVGDDRLRVRARTDYEDLDYLTRNPGELDRITVNSPPNGALPSDTPNVAANPSEGPLSADSLFDWISRRRNVERIASSERLIQNVEDPAPLLRDGRWQWCGRINGPHNYYNWVPNDNHWTLRGQSGGNWNTLVDDNPSGASWLIGTFTSNGEPIRNRQPDANDGDNNMGVVSSQQLQDGGYGGTWNSFGANGLNFTWYSGSTCTRITEVDTFVNPAIANDNAQHLKSLTHEFGHALGQSTNGAGGHEDEMFAIMFAGTFQQPPNYSSVWYGRMDDMAGVRDFLNTSNSNYPGTFVQETWVDMATWSQTHNNWGSAGSLIMTDANTYSGRRGDSFTIRGLQVENRGNLPATNVNLRFYLSSNTTITGSDYLAGSAIWDTFSPQGRWSNGSWTVSIPGNVPAGTYSIGWILSLDQTERSAANNTAIMRRSNTFNFTERQFTVIGQPDLTVNSVSLSPTSALQGETVMITSSVSNIGDATSPSTIVRFYRSSNSTISTADTALGQTVLGGLVAGGTTTRSYSAIMSVPGNWYLGACVEQVPFEDNVFNLCSPGVFIQVQAVDELFEDRFGLP